MSVMDVKQLELWWAKSPTTDRIWKQLPETTRAQFVAQLATLLALAVRRACEQDQAHSSSK